MAVRKKKGSGGGGGKNRKINVGKRNKGTGFNAEGVYRIKRAYYGIKPGGENNGRTWAETSCLFLQMEPVGHAGTSFMENALTYKAGNLDNMKPSQCGTHLVPVKKEYDGIPEGSKLDYLFNGLQECGVDMDDMSDNVSECLEGRRFRFAITEVEGDGKDIPDWKVSVPVEEITKKGKKSKAAAEDEDEDEDEDDTNDAPNSDVGDGDDDDDDDGPDSDAVAKTIIPIIVKIVDALYKKSEKGMSFTDLATKVTKRLKKDGASSEEMAVAAELLQPSTEAGEAFLNDEDKPWEIEKNKVWSSDAYDDAEEEDDDDE